MSDYVTVKSAANIDGSKYQYAERKGVDSVAFIMYCPREDRFALINEFKPPIGEYMMTAFGGSLDKDIGPHPYGGWEDKKIEIDKNWMTKQNRVTGRVGIVQQEVREEAGYDVRIENVLPLGRAFVSTQMNQFCYLYVVLIDDVFTQYKGRKPENASEEKARVVWRKREQIMKGEDWKSIMILSRFDNRNNGDSVYEGT